MEAVIGLPANLFYGTGIPACVLVLRQRQGNRSGKPAERRGKVLFINADREYFEGRAQNYLLPEHIEKIVNTFETFAEVPGFSAIVPNATLRDNDCNLNIRRYADNAPPPEPHDVRAHLLGGVPKAEVEAKAALFAAHGLDPMALFVERDRQATLRLLAPRLTTTARVTQARGRNQPRRARPRTRGARRLRCLVDRAQPAHHGARRRNPASSACATTCCPASAPRWSRWACSAAFRCAASSPASGPTPSTSS